jgi:flagellar biosynthesis protein
MNGKDKGDTEPGARQRAVALRYLKDKENAPRIVAKGSGHIAERIIEVARAHGITLYEDKELIEMLSRIELYQVIPVELYQIIAEVLAFVYRLNKQAPPSQPSK